MFAAVGMLLATSCQNDELDAVQSGNEATVSFTLGVEDGVQTRAISDGKTADLLVYQVLDKDGNAISTLSKVEQKVTFPYELTLTLAKGQKYQIAFWAQNSENTSAYSTANFPTVEVNYNGVNNDESRDAFFKTETITVTGNAELDVKLKRPFAQLNVGAYKSDWEAAVKSGVTIGESSVIIKNAGTAIDLRSGKVTGSDDVEVKYTSSAIPTEWLEIELDKQEGINETTEQFHWLSMSYILVNDGSENGKSKATLADVDFTFYSGGDPITLDDGLNNVPVQRNWRTNIYGKLLTGDVTFNIEIDPIYDGNYNNGIADELAPGVQYDAVNKTFSISSAEGLKWISDITNGVRTNAIAGTNFEGKIVKLTQDIDLKDMAWMPIGTVNIFKGEFDGVNYTISNLKVDVSGKLDSKNNPLSAGFFATAQGTVKNVTLRKVDVKGNGKTAAVVGDALCSRIENCHVDGGQIVSTPDVNKDNANNVGGIAGYLSAETQAFVKNCSVKNLIISAYRDLGGIAGTVGGANNIVSGNELENVQVIADQTVDYKEDKPANAGKVYGRLTNGATENAVSDNTINGVTVSVLTGENNAYEVSTADELFAVAAMINAGKDFGSKTIKLIQDIDLGGKNWEPINLPNGYYFTNGKIDGNNKKIINMTINKEGSGAGFIGISGPDLTIENLTFVNPRITVTGDQVGAVVGHLKYGTLTLNNVDVVNADFKGTGSTSQRIGGLVGFTRVHDEGASLIMKDCDVTGSTFTGYQNLGGLAGYVSTTETGECDCTLSNCTSINNTFYFSCVTSAYTTKDPKEWAWHPIAPNGVNPSIITDGFYQSNNVGVNQIAEGVVKNAEGVYEISTGEAFVYANENLFKNDGVKILLKEDIDMSNVSDYTPSEPGDNFSFDGGENTISGWKTISRGLFADRMGNKSITIKNLTLKNCEVNAANVQDENRGALLIGHYEGHLDKNTCTIEKVKIIGGSVTSSDYAAALVAYLYGGEETLSVTSCEIDGVTIIGNGSVGAIVGHAGGKQHNISSCTVKNSTIQGEENKKTGYLVGTFNQGKTVINNCSGEDNKYKDGDELKHMIGRFVKNSGATLSIDNQEQEAFAHTER